MNDLTTRSEHTVNSDDNTAAVNQSTFNLPSLKHALTTFLSIVTVIAIGLQFGTSLHSLMLICLGIAGGSAWWINQSHGFDAIQKAMGTGITSALSAIYIFILIGVLIAAFIQSGTVAALIYYGLEFLSPSYFLPAGLILCSLMSIATGTSWGTAGTAGIVLMGIGGAMGMPLPLVAGMVISGACFGDKMSPVSDTTNLAAMSAGTDLYTHIRSMLYTTVPAYLLALVGFSYLGQQYIGQSMPQEQVSALLDGINATYSINLICIVPFLVLLVLSLRRYPAVIAMLWAIISAILIAIVMQSKGINEVLNALYSGGKPQTGVETLDNLLSRGGIKSMMWTLSLSLLALALGGILSEFGFLRVLISGIVKRAKRTGDLVATTIVSCLVGNMSIGEAYMSIILGGQLYSDAYDRKGLNRAVLSRSLEEGATLTTPLIPWTTAGAFFATTLGVNVIDVIPYALVNLINPIIGIMVAYLGIGLMRKK